MHALLPQWQVAHTYDLKSDGPQTPEELEVFFIMAHKILRCEVHVRGGRILNDATFWTASGGGWLLAAGLAKYAETIVSASDAESVDDFALLSTEEVEALVKGVGNLFA